MKSIRYANVIEPTLAIQETMRLLAERLTAVAEKCSAQAEAMEADESQPLSHVNAAVGVSNAAHYQAEAAEAVVKQLGEVLYAFEQLETAGREVAVAVLLADQVCLEGN